MRTTVGSTERAAETIKEDTFRAQIAGIDETLALRVDQMADAGVESYTLGLLRNPNLAGKKFGEETVEVTMAVMDDSSVEACEGELADVMYSGLILALGRGKEVKLERVIDILVARNQAAAASLLQPVVDVELPGQQQGRP